jgi:predicted AAA+ superfamily ATPase
MEAMLTTITKGEEFPRSSLMNQFKGFLEAGEETIFITSPRATGKTSFLQLVRRDKPIDAIYFYVKVIESENPFQQLKTETGIEWNEKEYQWFYPDDLKERKVVIIVDDAHKIYHDEYFWTILFKSLVPTPKNFIFVFACSYLRTIGSMENPLILTPCRSRINVHDFLLSKEEFHQLILDDRIGLN